MKAPQHAYPEDPREELLTTYPLLTDPSEAPPKSLLMDTEDILS